MGPSYNYIKGKTLMGRMIFEDRREAGRQLGLALEGRRYGMQALLILGIPRGGLVVAEEVAHVLATPMDVIIAHKLRAPKELIIVPRASHLFEEPGALDKVAEPARDWFMKHFLPQA